MIFRRKLPKKTDGYYWVVYKGSLQILDRKESKIFGRIHPLSEKEIAELSFGSRIEEPEEIKLVDEDGLP